MSCKRFNHGGEEKILITAKYSEYANPESFRAKGLKKNAVVVIDADIMSGTPCFAGTRVPVSTAHKSKII
jgi:hypothetical protein